jgi:hypothetical protein
VRGPDEWFDEPDDLARVDQALAAIDQLDNPAVAAGVVAFRVARAQGFAEGNKRTALLLARWILDHNGLDGAVLLPREHQPSAVPQVADSTAGRRSVRSPTGLHCVFTTVFGPADCREILKSRSPASGFAHCPTRLASLQPHRITSEPGRGLLL